MLEQLLALYTDPENHNAQRHRQTDRRTDGQMDGQQAYANSRSYCVAVRPAKNETEILLTTDGFIFTLNDHNNMI